MPNKDTVAPIRARPFLAHGGERRDRPTKPTVFTRGAIRQQKPPTSSSAEHSGSIALEKFLELLRIEVNGLPLSIFVHGWGDPATKQFLEALEILKQNDAIWLIASNADAARTTPPIKRAVILNPDALSPDDSEARLYDNLLADIAYFPAADANESAYLKRLGVRVRALLIEEKAPHEQTLREAAPDIIRRFSWNGENVSGEFTDESGFTDVDLTPSAQAPSEERLDQIGWMLKAMTEHLSPNVAKRFEFRSYLENVKSRAPEPARWNEQLVLLADVGYEWPEWAVESLPALYVPLSGSGEDDTTTAYVWSRIRDHLLPETYEEKRQLCNGQFVELQLTAEGAARAEAIARKIDEDLRKNPYLHDSAYTGSVEQALLQFTETEDS